MSNVTWPAPYAGFNPPQRSLKLALGVSILLHAFVLSIHFKLPETLGKATEQALDVILVNSKSARKPVDAQARAQSNLDGGGNTDDDRRVKSPLPVAKNASEGNDLIEAKRRVAEMETRQQQLLTQAGSDKKVAAETKRSEQVQPTPAPSISGIDLAARALAIAHFEGEINRNIDEYNKRPRKAFIGARAAEYRFAQYVEDWRQKIERIGNLNYPESARGRLYGSLVITVIIKADGELDSIEINRPSGHKVLDEAARRIVRLAAPYAPFPPDIKRDTDVIEITRTWSFTNADRLQSN
ncbi:MAG: TonB family protein [Rhodocyclales bacterium]|nr:TonB family protein [Rhodocyclales bacterium]